MYFSKRPLHLCLSAYSALHFPPSAPPQYFLCFLPHRHSVPARLLPLKSGLSYSAAVPVSAHLLQQHHLCSAALPLPSLYSHRHLPSFLYRSAAIRPSSVPAFLPLRLKCLKPFHIIQRTVLLLNLHLLKDVQAGSLQDPSHPRSHADPPYNFQTVMPFPH